MKTGNYSKAVVILLFVFTSFTANAQETKKQLYDPSLDGMKQIKEAVAAAAKEGKHVLIQYGGNWCSWCIKFDAFCKADTSISKIINAGYIPVKLNYSPENKNAATCRHEPKKQDDYPYRQGAVKHYGKS